MLRRREHPDLGRFDSRILLPLFRATETASDVMVGAEVTPQQHSNITAMVLWSSWDQNDNSLFGNPSEDNNGNNVRSVRSNAHHTHLQCTFSPTQSDMIANQSQTKHLQNNPQWLPTDILPNGIAIRSTRHGQSFHTDSKSWMGIQVHYLSTNQLQRA